MRHGIHARRCREALGQRIHQFGVDDSHAGDVIGIHTDHLGLARLIDDDIVDCRLGCRAGRGGKGDDGQRLFLGVGDALQRDDVAELRVVDNDADALGGVHARTAADGHDEVGSGGLAGCYAGLDIGDGGVGLDVIKDLVCYAGLVHDIEHHLGDTKLH